MKKVRVGIIFGGRSGEHDVSLLSATSILQAIDRRKYNVVPIGITREGEWLVGRDAMRLLQNHSAADVARETNGGRTHAQTSQDAPGATMPGRDIGLVPSVVKRHGAFTVGFPLMVGHASKRSWNRSAVDVDVIFPVLHGPWGEDGTIQGLLELAGIPYVGAGVLGSAAGMDKDVMKRLFREAGLPIAKHETVQRRQWERDPARVREQIRRNLKYPVFVKPANLGSSVGITKAHDANELAAGVNEAAKYDNKIIVEQAVGGSKYKAREIECAVIGNEDLTVSIPGEIVPSRGFYDYEAKYLDADPEISIPAKIPHAQRKSVQRLALAAFRAVGCAGLARVDFLVDPRTGVLYVNEINTMPGFTANSMFPKLWRASGISYPKLIDRLISLGLTRHAEKGRNKRRRF
jgi:D-alanine-D-alanine ligase